jgi:hypothetical protein
MNLKNIATTTLLMFVAASIVVLVVKSLRHPQQSAQAGEGQITSAIISNSASRDDRLVVYYFHGKMRCPTCMSIESYAKEAVESGFAEQLKDGRLEWKIVNYEESGNEHFATDYNLAAPCVVLVKVRDNKQVDWRGLPEVWEHVGDKPAFVQFVGKNVREFLQ